MLEQILNKIPDYEDFLTVDEMDANSIELAEKYPNIVKLSIGGYSRKGHPIYILTIGSGDINALFYGCPHPNEPIGAMMLEFLSKELATNSEFREAYNYTWHIIKCIDIDGTKLNEGWFKGDLTLTRYAKDFFRPAAYEQVEWTYPFKYKDYSFENVLPETKVLMNLIDQTKPEFVYGLHNAGFGGTYWYINKNIPELWDKFYAASSRQSLPLHLGEPEVSYIEPYAPAIYSFISTKETYDYYEKYGEVDPADMLADSGGSTESYIKDRGLNSICLITELPYFYDDRIASDKLMGFSRREAIMSGLKISEEIHAIIDKWINPVIDSMSIENPFIKMVKQEQFYFKNGLAAEIRFINENDEYNKECKESEYLDSNIIRKFYTLLSLSLAIRSCEFEIDNNNFTQLIEEARDKLSEVFKERSEECEEMIKYKVIPIKKLISVQLECGLLLMKIIQKNEEE